MLIVKDMAEYNMDMTLIPTEKLIEELFARSNSIIFGALLKTNDKKNEMKLMHGGSFATMIGLCQLMHDDVMKHYYTMKIGGWDNPCQDKK